MSIFLDVQTFKKIFSVFGQNHSLPKYNNWRLFSNFKQVNVKNKWHSLSSLKVNLSVVSGTRAKRINDIRQATFSFKIKFTLLSPPRTHVRWKVIFLSFWPERESLAGLLLLFSVAKGLALKALF